MEATTVRTNRLLAGAAEQALPEGQEAGVARESMVARGLTGDLGMGCL